MVNTKVPKGQQKHRNTLKIIPLAYLELNWDKTSQKEKTISYVHSSPLQKLYVKIV